MTLSTPSSWLEIALIISGEIAEPVASALEPFAHQGVIIEPAAPIQDPNFTPGLTATPHPLQGDVKVRAFVPFEGDLEQTKTDIERALWPLEMIARNADLHLPKPTYTPIVETNWVDLWKKHYKPLRVGKNLMIVPAWEAPNLSADDVAIIIEPGQAFGTGTHPSTQLCLGALEKYLQPGDSVADIGCGSGILAIAAAKLNAGPIYACDIEAESVAATGENGARNGVKDKIEVDQGSLEKVLEREPYDVVVVNILAKIIVGMFEGGLEKTVKPDGTLLLAGILGEQADMVGAAFEARGMTLVEKIPSGDWVGLVVRHK